MSVLEVKNVSIRYLTGDFKDIGLKEYVMRRLTGNYHVNEFWADREIYTVEGHFRYHGTNGRMGKAEREYCGAVGAGQRI